MQRVDAQDDVQNTTCSMWCGPGTAAWAGCAKIPKVKWDCGDYLNSYREIVSEYGINVDPYAAAFGRWFMAFESNSLFWG